MIVNCMVYRSGHPAETVDIEDISEVIRDTDAFIWLGLWQPEPAFMYKVREEFGLHDLAVEDALNAHQRPKIERYGSSAFIVVKPSVDRTTILSLAKRICLWAETSSLRCAMVLQ